MRSVRHRQGRLSYFVWAATHRLPGLCALLDISDELLLALFQLCPLAIEFALRFGERALMLTQSLSRRDRSSE